MSIERLKTRNASRLRKQDVQADGSTTLEGLAPLSTWVAIRRRYTRSINLERDLATFGSVQGYVPTARAMEALERIIDALITGRGARSFTLTGVYGTGKSAFAHFLTAVLAAASDPMRRDALQVLDRHPKGKHLLVRVKAKVPKAGFVRAVVTARREPLAHTVVRALERGVRESAARGRTPKAFLETHRLSLAVESGKPIDGRRLATLVPDVADAAGRGVVLVIDELGKVLEYCAQAATTDDVYLLQQLAETPVSPMGHPIAILGLLHQTFAEYGSRLSTSARTEWQKIQGRFEDIAFLEAPEQMLELMREAVSHEALPMRARRTLVAAGQSWHDRLLKEIPDPYVAAVLTPELIAAVAPLHPIAALALPGLCAKYAQHDRSLFSFLTSNEPHAFSRFLREQHSPPEAMPLHPLSALYDYFIDVAGHGLAFRPQFQRWAEVHGVVSDARSLAPQLLEALKTIGVLNLLTSASGLRASRGLVLAALASSPDDAAERVMWAETLDQLLAKGIVTYRSQLDEFRVWEGSEFDVERAIHELRRVSARSLSQMLREFAPLTPVVAQRHSYETGTLRYFERQYADNEKDLETVTCRMADSDGTIVYWVSDSSLHAPPATTIDGRPVVVVQSTAIKELHDRSAELAALRAVSRLPQLQADGVARKEVSTRIKFAEADLSRAVRAAFNVAHATVWLNGETVRLDEAAFNAQLSTLCDATYRSGITVWNEQINRRELTSAGARARRELIDAMIRRGSAERLGMQGDGPEASIYETVLRATGIHRPSDGGWTFGPPTDKGIASLWDAIEKFCVDARGEARSVDQLLALLDRPPYGVKRGIVPVLFAAVLLYHTDDISVYFQGSFVPVLGPEQWELLVKHPHQFSVKYFELTGVRWEVFRELEDIVRTGEADRAPSDVPLRNSTLLGVLRPLVRFATRLPVYTSKTKSLSGKAVAVRDALRSAREPDELLFRILPEALGLSAIPANASAAAEVAPTYRRTLLSVLRELDGAYDRLLERCRAMLYAAFGASGDAGMLRQDLTVRGQHLLGRVIEPAMQSVVLAMVNDRVSDKEWLEALVMVIADKPADGWTDDDATAFEFRVADAARRFRNLWSLLHTAELAGLDSVDARRISVTKANGAEYHHVVWIDRSTRDSISGVVAELVNHVSAFPREQQLAVAAAVAEAIFATEKTPFTHTRRILGSASVEGEIGDERAAGA